MPKHEPLATRALPKEIVVKTKDVKTKELDQNYKWWLCENDEDLKTQLLSSTNYLTKLHQPRIKQASIFTRLFSGKPLYNYLANTGTLDNSQQLPIGRPTANVCYSCTDTLTSRITQDRPKPTFLTDSGHYKERKVSEQLNNFIMGEFYRTQAYRLGGLSVRDACVLGDGLIKIFPQNKKVCLERTLDTELLTDYNDAYYGNPRTLIHKKLVDRGTFIALFPDESDVILGAQHGNVDNSPISTDTISDQFIVAEGWHLPSAEGAGDGRHVIACSSGIILDDPWTKMTFPFVKLSYNPNMVGFFSQSLCEILMPTQMEIYKLLIIMSQAIELMGVPRILVEEMSKILETSFNNNLGTIVKYRNTPPNFVNATANNTELYEWVKWLIQNAYQMSGISAMSAQSAKPAGLNSGEAIRSFDDLQTGRFAAFSKRYQDMYTDLAYQVIDCARDIANEEGSYTTVYPNKDGTREIDLKQAGLIRDVYHIQCFEESSLPRDPAGRQARLSEMFAAGEISQQEFRRLSSFPDLAQSDQLANALEERILKTLDDIVENGKKGYEPPDSFMLDPTDLATTLTVNYINKYAVTDIEPEKLDLLKDFFTQVQVVKSQATLPQPVPMAAPPGAPGTMEKPPVAPPAPSVGPTSGVQV